MRDKILIDTSAWIEGFRKSGNRGLQEKLKSTLDSSFIATTNVIILELLQGCRDKKEHDAMRERMESLEVLPADNGVWDVAYGAGFDLRKIGITVPTVDLIIASVAKVHGCALLHHDAHFRLIARQLGLRAVDYLGE